MTKHTGTFALSNFKAPALLTLLLAAGQAAADAAPATPLPPNRTFELSRDFNNAWSVTFDANAQFLATENSTGDVEIWDATTGQRSVAWPTGSTLRAKPFLLIARPAALAFLPSGDLLVGRGTHLAIHRRADGQPQRQLPPTAAPISSVVVSRDGSRACAVLAEDLPASLAFWNLADGHKLDHLPTQPGSTYGGGLRLPNQPDSLQASLAQAFGWTSAEFIVGAERLSIERWNLDDARVEARTAMSKWPGHITAVAPVGPDRIASVQNNRSLHLHDQNFHRDVVLLTNLPPTSNKATALDIRALSVSGDGQRIAIGGMRAGARPGVLAPKGDFVADVPIHGEIQVWDARTEQLVATLKGAADEKFLRIGLDPTGHRVVAASAGVRYTPRMMSAHQQSLEMHPTNTVRVSVWELPHR